MGHLKPVCFQYPQERSFVALDLEDMRPPLTERQREIFDAIRTFIRENGCAPSVKEIGASVGISSTNGVVKQLDAMERKGYIRRQRGRARSIQLIESEQSHDFPVQLPFVSSAGGLTRSTLRSGASGTLFVDRTILGRVDPDNCLVVVAGDDGMGTQGIRSGDLVIVEERPLTKIPGNALTVALTRGMMIVRRLVRLNNVVRLTAEQPGYRTELADQGSRLEVIGMARAVIRALR
jgi:repressor LexA